MVINLFYECFKLNILSDNRSTDSESFGAFDVEVISSNPSIDLRFI